MQKNASAGSTWWIWLRIALLAVCVGLATGITGCATTDTAYDNTAPDPAYYQSSDNPFHAD